MTGHVNFDQAIKASQAAIQHQYRTRQAQRQQGEFETFLAEEQSKAITASLWHQPGVHA